MAVTATEKVVRGSGTNRKVCTHVAFAPELELAAPPTVPGRIPFWLDAELPIPAIAPPTFIGRHNELRWRLEVRIELPRWPDWVGKPELVVHP